MLPQVRYAALWESPRIDDNDMSDPKDVPPSQAADSSGKDSESAAGGAADRPAIPERRKASRGWRTPDVGRAALMVISLYIAMLLLWEARALILLTFLGVLFGVAVAAGADRLQRWRIPRYAAAAFIVFGTLGAMSAVFAWSAPALRSQSRELREKFPQAVERVDEWLERRGSGVLGSVISSGNGTDSAAARGATARPRQPARAGATPDTLVVTTPDSLHQTGSELRRSLVSRLGGLQKLLFPFVSSTIAALAGFIYLIFLAIYVGAEPNIYHSGLMHLFPKRRQKRAEEVFRAMGKVLRKWLVTQLIAMLAIGAVTTVALLILGIPAALPLGLIAGFLEFIPTIGPILSSIPAIVMGFAESPEKAGLVALVYIGIQFLENHILIPMLMREGVDLPPALTIVAQALMALLFGFLGLLVAVPALAAVMVAVKMLYVEDVVGEAIPITEPI
jgi:predicted PurR-regulated permease PerM